MMTMILIKILIKPSQRVSGKIRPITVYVWRLDEEKGKKKQVVELTI